MKTIEDILKDMRELLASVESESRAMNDEEVQKYEAYETELNSIRKHQEVQLRQTAYETPRKDLHINTGTESHDEEQMRMFDRYMRTGDQAIGAEFRAQSVGIDSAGGFTVPEVFRQKLVDRLKSFGGLASVVETITTTGGEDMRWPTLDDTANTGVIAAENTAPGSSGADLVFGEKTLGAFRYVAPGAGNLPLRVSVELLQDSAFDIQALVTNKLGQRIARIQAIDWVTGAGTTEPLGIGNLANNLTSAPAFIGATPDKDELITALHALDPDYRANAVWVFNDVTLSLIEKMEDSQGRPLLQPFAASGIDGNISQGRTLLGHRIVIDQAFANYTDASGNVWGAFGDMAETYVIRRVRDLQLVVDPFTRANEGQVQFTIWARADGTVQNDFSAVLLVNDAV